MGAVNSLAPNPYRIGANARAGTVEDEERPQPAATARAGTVGDGECPQPAATARAGTVGDGECPQPAGKWREIRATWLFRRETGLLFATERPGGAKFAPSAPGSRGRGRRACAVARMSCWWWPGKGPR
jgi:hypothetical protein